MVALFRVDGLANADERCSYAESAMSRLHAAIDDVGSVSLVVLNRQELEALTVGVLRASQRLQALSSAAVSEADQAGLGGRKSVNTYFADKLGTASSQIAPSRTLGIWLSHFGVLADAWAAGTLGEAHIRELKKLDNGRTRRALQRDQQMFVDWTATLDFNQWQTALGYWLIHADPDGALDPERNASYGIRTRVDKNGDVAFSGLADPITGAALLTMLDHLAQELLRDETDNGDPVTPESKRRLTALMILLARGFEKADGTHPVPLVNIVISEQVAEALLDDLQRDDGIDTAAEMLKWDDPDARCETIRGTPLHPRRAWPALLLGRLRRQVLNAKGRTINLGHDVRLFPPALKNALLVESRGRCSNSGCDAPFSWLQADHIQPHTKNGSTSLANGQILCGPDNHTKGDR